MRTSNDGFLQIALLLVFVVIAVLFLLTQQNTLKAVRRENRLMQPGMVWLQLIPLFGQIWQLLLSSCVLRNPSGRKLNLYRGDSLFGPVRSDVARKN